MHQQSARHAPGAATFLRAAEVAAILQVSPTTVARCAKHGQLPYQRTLGGQLQFPATIHQLAVSLVWEVRAR
jgi:predicted DNA-binding transcriptional regulator AlpA